MQHLVLHVGPHKTGSSAIQDQLARHRAALEALGVTIPACFRPEPHLGHVGLVAAIRQADRTALDGFAASLRASPFHTAIVSAEDLSYLGAADLSRLAAALGDLRVSVVYVQRRLRERLRASWQETLRHGFDEDFAAYAATKLGDPFRDAIVNPAVTLDPYCEVFGLGAIRILDYAQCSATGLFDAFLEHGAGIRPPAPFGTPRVHTSPPLALSEILRALNTIAAQRNQRLPGFADHLFHAAAHPAALRLQRRIATGEARLTIDEICRPLCDIIAALHARYGARVFGGAMPAPQRSQIAYPSPAYLLDPATASDLAELYDHVAACAQPPRAAATAPRRRILVGLIEHIGDIVACEPVARYLKQRDPAAYLAWAVLPRYRELIDTNPFIDETITLDCLTDWMKLAAHGGFDEIVDLHVNYRICQCCQIPLAKRDGNPFVTAYDWFDHGALLEAFSVGGGLPRLSAAPRIYPTDADRAAIDAIDLPPNPLVIHRQSNDPQKDWTEAGWRSLAEHAAACGLPVVEIGAVSDLPPLPDIRDLTGQLTILQSAEVLRRAAIFAGVDSGPAHLANALEIPGIVLLGQYAGFRNYTPFTGHYAAASPYVRLVRNQLGPVSEIEPVRVTDALSYIAQAIEQAPPPRLDPAHPPDPAIIVAPAGEASSPAASAARRAPAASPAEPAAAPDGVLPRSFAFYLPQFHPIAENDAAHGAGFSEWHKLLAARPLFPGHRQPRQPGELGFYDLRTAEVLRAQLALARAHGIDGFCFYYYYFEGTRLLHKPLDLYLASDLDAPFLCLWANENWTRRWDGGDREVIIEQHHSELDDLIALRALFRLFADPRYQRVEGRPVLMIYKAHLYPDIIRTTETWRAEAARHGLPGLYLIMVDDWLPNPVHPRELGFDASYEIPSNTVPDTVFADDPGALGLPPDFTGRIIDYAKFAAYHAGRPAPRYKRFRTVMLPWDNTPRYGRDAMIHLDHRGEHYRLWLLQALLDTARDLPRGERFVFLHSWNEWCEGTYLEPDRDNGRFFLEQTREAIEIAHAAIAGANSARADIIADLLRIQRFKDTGAFLALAGTRAAADRAARDVTAHQRHFGELRAEIAALQQRIATLAQDDSAAMLAAITGSTSWRLTAPLRAIVARLRRERHG